MNASQLFWLAPIGSLLALVYSYYFYASMMKADPGSEKSQEIASYVKEGAKSYLIAQYKVVGLFFIIAFAFFAFLSYVLEVLSAWTPIAFLTGGFFSALSGYLGMKSATNASNRTAEAATKSLNSALQIAFRSGAVMGFVVVGLGLLDITIWWKILNYVLEHKDLFKDSIFAVNNYTEITTIMLTFGIGACFQTLFARVSGGIFTKAANVGADLIMKTEAGISGNDPRNPACIVDNVSNNVGDVNGMGADLYESYCASILATVALGAVAFNTAELQNLQLKSILLPMTIAGVGIVFSIFGTYAISTKEETTQKELMGSINRGVNFATFFIAICSIALVNSLLPGHYEIVGSIITGLMAGIIIGWATNYYTSEDYSPTTNIAEQSTAGSATFIINGISTGMISTAIPVITIAIAILLAYGLANGFNNPSMGLYGIGIAAVGMLSTLGITLATNAYGSIANNASRNANMSEMSDEVRKRVDVLDSLSSNTAAIGKGFAIGSTVLTVLALIGAYIEEIRISLLRVAKFSNSQLINYIYPTPEKAILIDKASIHDFMSYYNINLMNPVVLIGIFIGSMLVFLFCALTMKAVGRTAQSLVEEIKRQFKEIPAILKGEEKADYASCVTISTQGAQKEMIIPSLLAIIIPIVIGLILGVPGIIGMLTGGLSTGFVLAIMMSNAGGAWNNAKKYIGSGQLGGKSSDNYKTAIVGDTVGNLFKDTAVPSMIVLIKLMSMIAIVIAGLTVAFSSNIQYFIGLNPTDLSNKKAYAIANDIDESEDLLVSKYTSSSIYEDPLLGTEDIILPTDEELLRVGNNKNNINKESKKTSKETKPTFSEIKQQENKKDNNPNSGFSSGFGGGFDSFDTPANTSKKEETKPNTSSGFDSGFGGFDSFDTPADTGKKEETQKIEENIKQDATPKLKESNSSNTENKPEEIIIKEETPKIEESNSNTIKNKLEETKTDVSEKANDTVKEVSEKVEDNINKSTEPIKESVEEKKDAFEGGFDDF